MHVSRAAEGASTDAGGAPAAPVPNGGLTLVLPDEAATLRLGAALAPHLRAGDVVFLQGELGAGKTTLARAIIAARAGVDEAPSPTYTLVQTYTAPDLEIWHADLYRIADPEDVVELGLEEAFDEALVLVEWPDRLGPRQPENRLEVQLTYAPDGAGRAARITGVGTGRSRLDELAPHL